MQRPCGRTESCILRISYSPLPFCGAEADPGQRVCPARANHPATRGEAAASLAGAECWGGGALTPFWLRSPLPCCGSAWFTPGLLLPLGLLPSGTGLLPQPCCVASFRTWCHLWNEATKG